MKILVMDFGNNLIIKIVSMKYSFVKYALLIITTILLSSCLQPQKIQDTKWTFSTWQQLSQSGATTGTSSQVTWTQSLTTESGSKTWTWEWEFAQNILSALSEEKISYQQEELAKHWFSLFPVTDTLKWFDGDKNLCKSWNDLYFCGLLNVGLFEKEFKSQCTSYESISSCDLLDWKAKSYCQWDYYLMKMVKTKDVTVCNNFKKDFSFWNLMWSQKTNNYDLCKRLYSLVSWSITTDSVQSFVNDVWSKDVTVESIKGILNSNSQYADEKGFIDYIKNQLRTWAVSCDKLAQRDYILTLMKWQKFIFRSKEDFSYFYTKYATGSQQK